MEHKNSGVSIFWLTVRETQEGPTGKGKRESHTQHGRKHTVSLERESMLALIQACLAEAIAWRVVTTSGPEEKKLEL